MAGDGGQPAVEPDRAPGLGVPVAAEDEQVAVAEPLGRQVLEEAQRRVVGGVQVVEGDDEPALPGDAAQEPGHRLEQPEPCIGRLGGRSEREARDTAHQLGDQLGDVRPPRPKMARKRLAGQRGDGCPHDLDPRPEGLHTSCLPATSPRRTHLGGRGRVHEGLEKAGLADPGLTGDEEQPPTAGPGVVQCAPELGQLVVPAKKRQPRGCAHRPPLHRPQMVGTGPSPALYAEPVPSGSAWREVSTDLVGRDHELDELLSGLGAAVQGRGGVTTEIRQRFPATVELTVAALAPSC